jgi:hypothetical protein
MVHIVQLLLPLFDNDGRPFADAQMAAIREELVARFGGVTATRTPANGVWAHRGKQVHDDIILVEVMTDALDRGWWRAFRTRLEAQLRQDTIIIRTQVSELL